MNATPFLVIYLIYCFLFGVMLYDEGAHQVFWSGATILLSGLGIVALRRLKVEEIPLVLGVLYCVGVGIGLFFYVYQIGSDLISAVVLTMLFLMGIGGNVLYFLCEKQKLDYLNGQISESGLTLRRFEHWFPLWLVLFGNILLVGLVTPLLWGAWFKIAGTHLFKVEETKVLYNLFGMKIEYQATADVSLRTWFGYLIENVNQSLLGVASLIGITLPKKVVTPTGAGKILVAVFRIGILSLGLGALKRYLDLKKTTRLLMLAMGRAGWEQEKWESEVEGKRTVEDTGASFQGRRNMWQLRMRQLLQLFPGQRSWVLNEIAGRGDFQLYMQGRLKKQDLKIPEGHEPAFQPKHLSDWIRSELAEVLADPNLYADAPGTRYEVLRSLCGTLSKSNAAEIPPRIRTKLILTLMKLRRSNDPIKMVERVERCLTRMVELGKERAEATDDAWEQFNEERSRYAALYALVQLGRTERLVELLPALRKNASAIQVDTLARIDVMVDQKPPAQACVLRCVERLLIAREDDHPLPILDELKIALGDLTDEENRPYRTFAARALGYFLITAKDPELLTKGTETLLACGHQYAIKAIWRLVRLRDEIETRQLLLNVLIAHGLERTMGQFLRLKLVAGDAGTELLAAELLGELPATVVSRKALREASVDPENSIDVRWRSLCSLGRLAQAGDRQFLEQVSFSKERPRLWAANQYALARCGSVDALEDSLDVLATQPSTDKLYKAVFEVFEDENPERAEAICQAFDTEASNEERLEACETLVGMRAPSALLVLARLLLAPETPKKIRQTAAEDLGILGRSLHNKDLGLLAAERAPADWACEPLLKALEDDSDRLVRIRSARALGRLGLPTIQERFRQSLLNPDENANVRQVVAQAVAEMGDTSWLEFLEQQFPVEKSAQVRQGMILAFDRLGAEPDVFLGLLDEKNAKVKTLALKALSRRGLKDDQKVLLMPLLEDKHKDVRAAAAECIGIQHYEEAIPELCELTDQDKEGEKVVRRACLKALQQLVHTDEQLDHVWPFLETVWDKDDDHLVIRDCAATMARLYREKAAPTLLKAFTAKKKRQPWTKSYAGVVWALGETRAPEARDVLFQQLLNQLKAEEYNFSRLISLIRPGGLAGGPDALPMLLKLVHDNSEAYSWVSCQVIAEIGHFAAIAPLTDILESRRADDSIEPNTEAAILISLVRLGVWERLDELIALLHDTSHEKEVARRRALGMLPDIDMGLSPMLLMQVMNPRSTPHEKLRETATKSLGSLAGRMEQTLQVLQWQAQADPRAKIRESAQSAIETVSGRLERTLRKLRRNAAFDTQGKISFNGAPVHPAWGEAPDEVTEVQNLYLYKELAQKEAEEAAKALEDAKAASDQAKAETPAEAVEAKDTKGVTAAAVPVVAEPAAPPAPTFKITEPSAVELMVKAILDNERKAFEKEHKAASSPQLPGLWKDLLDRLGQIDTFQQAYEKEWLFVPGNPKGKAEFWPFVVMNRKVSRREYALFCEATDHPLPSQWRNNRQNLPDHSPVSRISWFDAEAYAKWKGLQLPTHGQLAMANQLPIQSIQGEAATFPNSDELAEWTRSTHPRRHKLVQTFSMNKHEKQHMQKLDTSDELGFRCIQVIDAKKEPLCDLLLKGAHRDLSRLFAYCAKEAGIALPYERDQWMSFLLDLVGELPGGTKIEIGADATRKPALTEAELLARKQQEAEAKEAELKRLREEAEARRLEEERRKREEEERRRREEEQRIAQQNQRFWEHVQQGTWSDALSIYDAEGDKLDKAIKQAVPSLRAFVKWINANQHMLWYNGNPNTDAYKARPVMLPAGHVTRKQYSEFCDQHQVALPRGWKTNAAEVSDPNSSAVGISLYDAKAYASRHGAKLPSIDQLQALANSNVYANTYEWTQTTRQKRKSLYYVFNGLNHRYDYYGPSTRSHQQQDQPLDVAFRLCYDIDLESLPPLLQELLSEMPEGIQVQGLPYQLGQAVYERLQTT